MLIKGNKVPLTEAVPKIDEAYQHYQKWRVVYEPLYANPDEPFLLDETAFIVTLRPRSFKLFGGSMGTEKVVEGCFSLLSRELSTEDFPNLSVTIQNGDVVLLQQRKRINVVFQFGGCWSIHPYDAETTRRAGFLKGIIPDEYANRVVLDEKNAAVRSREPELIVRMNRYLLGWPLSRALA